MTKAEAKEYLDNYRKMYADLAPERFLEALDIMLNEPSLPSNLDEAAEEHLPESHGYFPCGISLNASEEEGWSKEQMLAMFKAGAEWMAGQGVSVDGLAGYCMGDVLCPDFELEEMSAKLKHAGFQSGDKVVVQIRKK